MTFNELSEKLHKVFGKHGVPLILRDNKFYVPFKVNNVLYETAISITPENVAAPGRVDGVFDPNYKRLTLEFGFEPHIPNFTKVLEVRGTYYYPVTLDDEGNIRIWKLISQVRKTIQSFSLHMSNREDNDRKAKELENERVEAERRLKAKLEQKRKSLEDRKQIFDKIKTVLKDCPGMLESELENEYVNLTLPSGVKVCVQANQDSCSLSSIELRRPLKLDEIPQLLKSINEFVR